MRRPTYYVPGQSSMAELHSCDTISFLPCPKQVRRDITYSKSSPGTASGLLDTDIFSAGNAAGNLADVATIAVDFVALLDALQKTEVRPESTAECEGPFRKSGEALEEGRAYR